MRIEHGQYRTFESDGRTEQSVGFIDGDLVEGLLDMSRDSVEKLIDGLTLPAAAVLKANVDVELQFW
uniref:Peptidylprolyl isomerase n=1 Tax=Ascaris lumbricoides TaxID=6252 RepID=A0A0M3IV57_ASCLU